MIYISIALLIPMESLSKDTQTQHLFKIERSKNANIVQYDVQMKTDGKLDPRNLSLPTGSGTQKTGKKKTSAGLRRALLTGSKLNMTPKRTQQCSA
jgi:hypothetical protein